MPVFLESRLEALQREFDNLNAKSKRREETESRFGYFYKEKLEGCLHKLDEVTAL